MSCGWSCFTCSSVPNRFNHHGICLNNSKVLLLGGRSRKEERCPPLVLQLSTKNEFRTLKLNPTCPPKRKEHQVGLTETLQPVSNDKKDGVTKIIGDEDVVFDSNFDGSFNGRNLVFIQNICDISPPFEDQDLFPGVASTYDPNSKLLFIGGGFDTTKAEFSKVAQVFEYDGRLFHPAFDHISDLPTTASVGCSVSFNITMEEKAIYLFGGQEDWRNSDDEKWEIPKINFSNRLFRFDLRTGTWKELHTKGAGGQNVPSPRSQAFCFIRKEQLYIYGGYDGKSIFSDLYKLDLVTLEWHLMDTSTSARPKEYKGLLKPPDAAQPVNYKPLAAITGRHLFVVGEDFEIFHFDLVTQIWNQLPSKFSLSECKSSKLLENTIPITMSTMPMERKRMAQHIKSLGGADLIISDKTLYVTGGEDPNSNNDNLLISYYNLPRKLDWSIERLLWLACFKNNVKYDQCFLSQCPPMIIYKIISFINGDIFIM